MKKREKGEVCEIQICISSNTSKENATITQGIFTGNLLETIGMFQDVIRNINGLNIDEALIDYNPPE